MQIGKIKYADSIFVKEKLRDVINWLNEPEIKELVDNNEFSALYTRCLVVPLEILTSVFIASDIEFLSYLKIIPIRSFLGLPLKSIKIPNNIKTIEEKSFLGCSFEEIVIPEGVEAILTEAFSFERSLQKATLPQSLKLLGMRIFYQCENLKVITYNGTLRDLKDLMDLSSTTSSPTIREVENFFGASSLIRVECSDAIIEP